MDAIKKRVRSRTVISSHKPQRRFRRQFALVGISSNFAKKLVLSKNQLAKHRMMDPIRKEFERAIASGIISGDVDDDVLQFREVLRVASRATS